MTRGKFNPRSETKQLYNEFTMGAIDISGITTVQTTARAPRNVRATLLNNASGNIFGIAVRSAAKGGVVTLQVTRQANSGGSGIGGIAAESGFLVSGYTATLVIDTD